MNNFAPTDVATKPMRTRSTGKALHLVAAGTLLLAGLGGMSANAASPPAAPSAMQAAETTRINAWFDANYE